jgi:two-component system, OmpR family, phosphate regulon sensor histidine kinase PhoR
MSNHGTSQSKLDITLLVVRGVAAVLFGLTFSYSLVYWAAALLRGGLTDAAAGYGYHLLIFAITLLVSSGVMFVFSRVLGPRQQDIFRALSDAMRRIAQGDFDVAVAIDKNQKNNPVGTIASSLNQMAESLKKVEAMRQEFVSNVSHEIQSPLTSISGFARALRDDDLPREQRHHYLGIIEAESARLSRLSDSLLKLSALDARTRSLEPKAYRLDAQLRSVVLACEPQWKGKGLQVSAELDALTVTADQEMLGQVWANLVHNAIKFTPAGGRIRLVLQACEGDAVIRISDSGIGIGPDDLPRVFERFFKADKARSAGDGTAGSGLGLSIAQKIVALHGGTLEAESAGAGQGATFSVRLPVTERQPA